MYDEILGEITFDYDYVVKKEIGEVTEVGYKDMAY